MSGNEAEFHLADTFSTAWFSSKGYVMVEIVFSRYDLASLAESKEEVQVTGDPEAKRTVSVRMPASLAIQLAARLSNIVNNKLPPELRPIVPTDPPENSK